MTEIIIEQNSDEEALENLLRLLTSGGTSQQRLAAEGAIAAGYLGTQESLPENIQQFIGDTRGAILKMIADPNLETRQAGMELAWNQYVGRRAARHAKKLNTDLLFE